MIKVCLWTEGGRLGGALVRAVLSFLTWGPVVTAGSSGATGHPAVEMGS